MYDINIKITIFALNISGSQLSQVKMEISELYEIFKKHPEITTDSRNCPEGSIFFALKGESFNGNAFARSALEKGCAYAVIDEKEYLCGDSGRMILTDDCLETLQQLAAHHRRVLGTKIIGVTGTNGKTTTKELIATVLAKKYNVLYTQGNFNNHIGVPKTLLRLTKDTEIAVVEMGANHPGEIKKLTSIAAPDYGIITNVGMAHLEGFGSFEGVVHTKGELYDYLRNNHRGPIFIDANNEHLTGIAGGLEQIRYGLGRMGEDVTVGGKITGCRPYLEFAWHRSCGCDHLVRTHLIGSYNVYNMLAACCIGTYFGVQDLDICDALAGYVPSNNRSQLEKTEHNSLIVDTYNANPTSMMAALTNFRDMEAENKMLVLGDMRELGSASAEEHQKIVDFIHATKFENVILVGTEFAGTSHYDYPVYHDVDELIDIFKKNRPENKTILIKGSNGIKLFRLPEIL